MKALLAIPVGLWTTVFGIVAAVDAYLLIQSDIALDPVAKVVLGALAVALAVLKTPGMTNASNPTIQQGTAVTVVTPEGEPNKVTTV